MALILLACTVVAVVPTILGSQAAAMEAVSIEKDAVPATPSNQLRQGEETIEATLAQQLHCFEMAYILQYLRANEDRLPSTTLPGFGRHSVEINEDGSPVRVPFPRYTISHISNYDIIMGDGNTMPWQIMWSRWYSADPEPNGDLFHPDLWSCYDYEWRAPDYPSPMNHCQFLEAIWDYLWRQGYDVPPHVPLDMTTCPVTDAVVYGQDRLAAPE